MSAIETLIKHAPGCFAGTLEQMEGLATEARAELRELRADHKTLNELRAVKPEIQALHDEVKELEADRGRLEWLIAHPKIVIAHEEEGGKWWWFLQKAVARYHGPFDTFRAAIDAAMKAGE